MSIDLSKSLSLRRYRKLLSLGILFINLYTLLCTQKLCIIYEINNIFDLKKEELFRALNRTEPNLRNPLGMHTMFFALTTRLHKLSSRFKKNNPNYINCCNNYKILLIFGL